MMMTDEWLRTSTRQADRQTHKHKWTFCHFAAGERLYTNAKAVFLLTTNWPNNYG